MCRLACLGYAERRCGQRADDHDRDQHVCAHEGGGQTQPCLGDAEPDLHCFQRYDHEKGSSRCTIPGCEREDAGGEGENDECVTGPRVQMLQQIQIQTVSRRQVVTGMRTGAGRERAQHDA